MGDRQPFFTFLAALMINAWLGGTGPSLLVMGAGLLVAMWFFLIPRHSLRVTLLHDQLGVFTFCILGMMIVALSAMTRRTLKLHQELSRAELLQMTSVNRLITGLAHEIRNPLNAIRLNLSTVKRRLPRTSALRDDIAEQILDASTDEIARIEELMQEMLGYVRDQPHPRDDVDLTAEVRSLLDFFAPVLVEDNIHLQADLPVDPLRVLVSRRHLRQVL